MTTTLTPTDLLPLRPAVLHVLLALAQSDAHGYAIMKHAETTGGGAVNLGPGTLYGTLGRLLDSELIVELDLVDPEDARRRTYRITALGREVLEAEVERLERVVRAARTPQAVEG